MDDFVAPFRALLCLVEAALSLVKSISDMGVPPFKKFARLGAPTIDASEVPSFPSGPSTKAEEWLRNSQAISVYYLPHSAVRQQQAGKSREQPLQEEEEEDPSYTDIIKQLYSKPTSQEQPGLEMVGSKFRKVDNTQLGLDSSLNPHADWETIERRLSRRDRDSTPASQHHSASPDLSKAWQKRRLTTKGASTKLSSVLCHIPERRYLPVSIAGVDDYALPDTGVRGNVITYDYALSVGAVIDESQKREFKNARKQAFGSLGTTRLDVSLTDDPTKRWTCNFDVVETLAAPLVLGNQFLEMAGIFKTFAHHLVKKALEFVRGVGSKTVYTFMHMGSPGQKLGCLLDAELVFADVDSGSHLNFVSPDLVKAQGLDVIPLLDEEAWVMLADGELVKLEGYVETTLGIGGGCIKERFYVLEGLSCDAVIGDPTIESLDIFNKFSNSLIDLDLPEERDNFYNIAWVETSKALADIEEETNQLLGKYNASTNVANDTGINMHPNASSVPLGSGSKRERLRKMLSPSISRRNQAPSSNDVMNHLRHRLSVLEKTWRECASLYNKLPDDERDRQEDQYRNTEHDYDRIRTTLTDHIHDLRNPA